MFGRDKQIFWDSRLQVFMQNSVVTRFMLFAKLVSCRHFPSSDLWAVQTLGVLRRMDRENFG